MQADSGIDIDDPLYFEVVSTLLNSTSIHDIDIDPAAIESCKLFLDSEPELASSQEKYEKCILDWRVHHGSWVGEHAEEMYDIDPSEVTIVHKQSAT